MAAALEAAEAFQQMIPKGSTVITSYIIPKALQRDGVAKKIGMRELTVDEELRCSKLGRGEYMKAQFEAVKTSICMLDDKPVDNSAGVVDVFYGKIGPKVRTLLLKKYIDTTTASTEEEDDFFKSEQVRVG